MYTINVEHSCTTKPKIKLRGKLDIDENRKETNKIYMYLYCWYIM